MERMPREEDHIEDSVVESDRKFTWRRVGNAAEAVYGDATVQFIRDPRTNRVRENGIRTTTQREPRHIPGHVIAQMKKEAGEMLAFVKKVSPPVPSRSSPPPPQVSKPQQFELGF